MIGDQATKTSSTGQLNRRSTIGICSPSLALIILVVAIMSSLAKKQRPLFHSQGYSDRGREAGLTAVQCPTSNYQKARIYALRIPSRTSQIRQNPLQLICLSTDKQYPPAREWYFSPCLPAATCSQLKHVVDHAALQSASHLPVKHKAVKDNSTVVRAQLSKMSQRDHPFPPPGIQPCFKDPDASCARLL
jgi:hypothetical protein